MKEEDRVCGALGLERRCVQQQQRPQAIINRAASDVTITFSPLQTRGFDAPTLQFWLQLPRCPPHNDASPCVDSPFCAALSPLQPPRPIVLCCNPTISQVALVEEELAHDHMFVILSDVWLDKPEVGDHATTTVPVNIDKRGTATVLFHCTIETAHRLFPFPRSLAYPQPCPH